MERVCECGKSEWNFYPSDKDCANCNKYVCDDCNIFKCSESDCKPVYYHNPHDIFDGYDYKPYFCSKKCAKNFIKDGKTFHHPNIHICCGQVRCKEHYEFGCPDCTFKRKVAKFATEVYKDLCVEMTGGNLMLYLEYCNHKPNPIQEVIWDSYDSD